MFNGYNETPLISYEYNQEGKKHENVAKWSYEVGVQQTGPQPQPSNRPSEFWTGKSNYLGIPKCNCTGCYPPSEKQSYQGDTRHRPWLPRSYPVTGTNDPCKLPGYQWDNGLTNQNPCYGETYMQENGGKYGYYKQYQKLGEPNQPGVITSLKSAEKPKDGGGRHQPVFCNPGYGLTPPKRGDGRNYCDTMEKYSYPMDHHHHHHHHMMGRLPVVEPFTKSVPSNLTQTRVPSTGYRSVKENVPQSYIDLGYGDGRKLCGESPATNGVEKRNESYPGEYTHFNREFPDTDSQKLYHTDYYARNNYQEAMKRTNQTLENRKDCVMSQINEMAVPDQHYSIPRMRYQEPGSTKPCDTFYQKEGRPDNSCFQRNDDGKMENVRVPVVLNDPRYTERTQNSYAYQNSSIPYRNYLGREYSYQNYNPNPRYEYPTIDYRPNQPGCEQLTQQLPFESSTPDKTSYGVKNLQFTDPQSTETRNPTYLEPIRGEILNKNGGTKISPLRLLRKKKFINVPQETAPVSSLNSLPGLDVRKFWSTWAEEEEENMAPTEVVVLDCQNIDPEQAKLLHLYETDPVDTIIKNGDEIKTTTEQTKPVEETNEVFLLQHDETEKPDDSNKTETETIHPKTEKNPKKNKTGKENRGKGKSETMDKWTEKKFDFLKRAEESKAAEILRHEEEKRKIFERRLSLQQQNWKKAEEKKKEEENGGTIDDNSNSPQNQNPELTTTTTNLPTCEYRRNKFLDWNKELEDRTEKPFEDTTNPQFWDATKPKEEPACEMDDILKKISEINFQCPDLQDSKKQKTGKKSKRKKTESQTEDDRTDKLTVETATKPTIKFSIQKSHDLKISFKVLNSSKCSDEHTKGEDADEKEIEDSNNSTELITFKYKSIQNEEMSNLKKSRRRKKQKSSFGRLKKSKYSLQEEEERDPLAVTDLEKRYPDPTDGFQVQETMDSAKIKLTFKRHKGNFETEYKINGNNLEKMAEEKERPLEGKERSRKKAKKLRKAEIFSDAESFSNCREPSDDVESLPEVEKPECFLEENSRNSCSTSPNSELNCDFHLSTFPDFPSEEKVKKEKETKDEELILINFGADDPSEAKFPPSSRDDVTSPHVSSPESKSVAEEIEEISFDFIKSTKSVDSEKAVEECKDEGNAENPQSSYEFKSEREEMLATLTEDVGLGDLESENISGVEVERKEETISGLPNLLQGNDEVVHDLGGSGDLKILIDNLVDESKCGCTPRTNSSTSQDSSESELEKTKESEIRNEMYSQSDFEILLEKDESQKEFESSLEVFENSRNEDMDDFENSEKENENSCESNEKLEKEYENPVSCRSLTDDLLEKEYESPDVCQSLTEDNLEKEYENSETMDDNLEKEYDNSDASQSIKDVNLGKEYENSNACQSPIGENLVKEYENSNIRQSLTDDNLEKEYVRRVGESSNGCLSPPEDNLEEKEYETSDVCRSLTDGILEKEYESEDACQSLMEDDADKVYETSVCQSLINENIQKVYENAEECQSVTEDNLEKVYKTSDICQSFTNDLSKEYENSEVLQSLPDDKLSKDYKKDDFVPIEKVWPSTKPETSSFSSSEKPTISSDPKNVSEDTEKFQMIEKEDVDEMKHKTETSLSSPLTFDLEQSTGNQLADDSGCAECSFTIEEAPPSEVVQPVNDKTTQNDSSSDMELEEGEIVDSSDENPAKTQIQSRDYNFPIRKIERRNSESQISPNKKFSKSTSCPPKLEFREEEQPKRSTDIPVEDIPLPIGPPQHINCFNFTKYINSKNAEPNSDEICSKEYNKEQSGVFQRSTKIKFSFLKRSKHSKIDLKSIFPPETKEENRVDNLVQDVQDIVNDSDVKVDLPCEDLEEGMESMSDLMRDEFFECEDIPTSEDLTNGEDLENEKVNDDKFRNIMQNCLDNAKKFLNVGIVDDLLELDNRESSIDSTIAPISRDVLLASNDDTNLSLTENVQPDETSMDFVPSFCTDEILPVDNWPYLEEEVPSSPIVSKSEENDLMATLINPPTIDVRRKRFVSETSYKQFQSKSELSNGETKIQRRNTIERINYRKDLRDLKKDLIRWKKSATEEESLKCQLNQNHSEEKPKSKNLDYKSPTWQPKVMLFRISKTELRKVLESSKMKKRLTSDSERVKPSYEPKTVNEITKTENLEKFEGKIEPQMERKKEKSLDLLKLNTIKGSLTSGDLTKRKKSRFRNLHSKRKPETETNNSHSDSQTKKHKTEEEKQKKCEENRLHEKSHSHERHKEWKHSENRHKDRKRERRDERKHRDREKHEKRGSSHDKPEMRKSPDGNKRFKRESEDMSKPEDWVCEIDTEEKLNIKSHPFHCQSCHLAFRTEAHFTNHLREKHKDIRNQHHCLLCELSFDTEDEYQVHLETREHTHLESVEKNTINTLFTLLTGAPCPVLGLVEMKPEWLPNQAGTVHFYHQATPLSLALQYLKMHHDLMSLSTPSSTHPN